jgi:hypothetical protein
VAKIIRVLKHQTQYFDDYCVVAVLLDDGLEASIYIGGECETWFDAKHNRVKAHVRRAQSRGKLDTQP